MNILRATLGAEASFTRQLGAECKAISDRATRVAAN